MAWKEALFDTAADLCAHVVKKPSQPRPSENYEEWRHLEQALLWWKLIWNVETMLSSSWLSPSGKNNCFSVTILGYNWCPLNVATGNQTVQAPHRWKNFR